MYNHFEKLVGSFLSISLHLLYNPVFQLLDIYTISMMTYDDMSTWKPMYKCLLNSFINNQQKLETIQMSVHRWVDEQIVVHPFYGNYSRRKNELPIPSTTWMNFKCIILTDRSQTQKLHYVIPLKNSWEKLNGSGRGLTINLAVKYSMSWFWLHNSLWLFKFIGLYTEIESNFTVWKL